ncbi:DUF3099 domain-containing protein [Paractinoplanes maris]|uniref:DUF3099 domain-containing protein n=1 Tax=Paractinoplanes maris TaxID=1734446 RepID=UPI0020216D81|nr:DUF3099 domain-containing protein [Actinoplanes maris]
MNKSSKQPFLITSAARSQEELFRARHRRYLLMMSGRAGLLVLGTVVVSVRPPVMWPWLVLCVAGMVLLPWIAVLVANDRPARPTTERAASTLADEPRQTADRASALKKREMTCPTIWP